MDFTTDSAHPKEIAYFDRGPIDPNVLVLGGDWSAYWYNGHIYASEISRGLDIFDLTPSKFLTQNEIDAAKSVKVAELNVQNSSKSIEVWPKGKGRGSRLHRPARTFQEPWLPSRSPNCVMRSRQRAWIRPKSSNSGICWKRVPSRPRVWRIWLV